MQVPLVGGPVAQERVQVADRAGVQVGLALLSRNGLTAEQIRERVLARFPQAAPPPGRPDLDRLLEDAGVGLAWDPEVDRYVLPDLVGIATGTTRSRSGTGGTVYASPAEADAEAADLDRRLDRLLADGGFVRPPSILAGWTGPPGR